jgi:hypothetical protein
LTAWAGAGDGAPDCHGRAVEPPTGTPPSGDGAANDGADAGLLSEGLTTAPAAAEGEVNTERSFRPGRVPGALVRASVRP